MSSSFELRQLYNRLKDIETQEDTYRKQLKTLTKTKDDIRTSIEKYMVESNVQMLEVSGTPDSLELVEQRKYETLNKEAVIRKIIQFYQGVGSTSLFQELPPIKQAEAVIHAIYTERDHTIVQKLKMKTNKNVQRVQETIANLSPSVNNDHHHNNHNNNNHHNNHHNNNTSNESTSTSSSANRKIIRRR